MCEGSLWMEEGLLNFSLACAVFLTWRLQVPVWIPIYCPNTIPWAHLTLGKWRREEGLPSCHIPTLNCVPVHMILDKEICWDPHSPDELTVGKSGLPRCLHSGGVQVQASKTWKASAYKGKGESRKGVRRHDNNLCWCPLWTNRKLS